MIGCPSHRAPLGLMVFRPGMVEGGGGGMDREKVFCCDQLVAFVRVEPCGQTGRHLHRVQAATTFTCPLTDMLSVSHTHLSKLS